MEFLIAFIFLWGLLWLVFKSEGRSMFAPKVEETEEYRVPLTGLRETNRIREVELSAEDVIAHTHLDSDTNILEIVLEDTTTGEKTKPVCVQLESLQERAAKVIKSLYGGNVDVIQTRTENGYDIELTIHDPNALEFEKRFD